MGRDVRRIDLRRIWDPVTTPHPTDNSPIALIPAAGHAPRWGLCTPGGIELSDKERAAEPDEILPPPSAELVLIRVFVEAFLETAPRKQARAFMRVAAGILADEASLALTFPIRPKSDAAKTADARRKALAQFRALLPVLIARLPPR